MKNLITPKTYSFARSVLTFIPLIQIRANLAQLYTSQQFKTRTKMKANSNLSVFQKLCTNVAEILFGENKSDITDNVGQKLFKVLICVQMATNGFPDHRVLAHQNFSVT